MEIIYISGVLVSLMISQNKASMCISNCPPECDGYIPNGRHTGCFGGRMCSYECNLGYEKITGMLTCQGGSLQPLEFDLLGSDEPLCKPKSCSGVIPNGELSDKCIAKVGYNCEYTCNEGYSKQYDGHMVACDSTTTWNPNPHSLCTNYNQCPYDIPGADLDLSCRRHPGDKCDYTCREGYVHSHYASADCTGRLAWLSRIDALCIEIKCSKFIDHGLIEFPCTGKYGETCLSYKCYDPYIKPPQPPSLKCNASRTLTYSDTIGYWEWDKNDGQPCVREQDLCPSAFSNGQVSSGCHLQPGAECSYTCKAGCFKNPSVSMVHCSQSGGRWEESTDSLCSDCKRCPDRISNGRLFSLSCERRPSTTCDFACNYGCRKAASTLTCEEGGEWNYGRPCICSDPFAKDDQEPNNALVIIIVVVVLILLGLTLIVTVCCYCHRRQRNRQARNAWDTGVPMITPTAPPLDGRTPATGYRQSPYLQSQTTPAHNGTDRRQADTGYSDSGTAETDVSAPPPSYEQVTADPSRFKT